MCVTYTNGRGEEQEEPLGEHSGEVIAAKQVILVCTRAAARLCGPLAADLCDTMV